MKKTVLFTTLIFAILLFLPSCILGGGGDVVDVLASEEDRERDRRRGSGEDKCKYDNDCEEVCEDVFDESNDEENDGKVDACINLNYDIAIKFRDIMDALEDPYESNLKEYIDHSDFFELLDISVEPWVRSTRAREISSSQAEAMLVWVAREERISDAIVRAYKNYETDFDKFEGVANLLEQVAPSFTSSCTNDEKKCGEMFHAITKTAISGNYTSFRDIVKDSFSSHGETIYCEIFNQRCDSTTPGCSEVDGTEYDTFYNECN